MDLNYWNQKSSLQEFKIDSPQIQQQGPPQLIRRVSKRNVAIRDLASEAKPTENFEKLIRQMTPQDQGFVITCLKQHFVFSSLSETQLSTLVDKNLIKIKLLQMKGIRQVRFTSSRRDKWESSIRILNRQQLQMLNESFGESALKAENQVRQMTIKAAHVVQFGIQKHIQQEKSVLELMDHQNILKFYRSYKDRENIYFLTEFIPGMELFDAIRVIGLLGKAEAQFYCAQMILMMEYLHTIHQIVYRDIKPENIMVDDNGYLKLIDMGTAKSFKNTTTSKTFTIIGTPHYMAPDEQHKAIYSTLNTKNCLYQYYIRKQLMNNIIIVEL